MQAKVLGVLAGRDMPSSLLKEWAQGADVVLAADSGADLLAEAGIVPHALIGDLDSVSPEQKGGTAKLVEDLDQETTDCDKLLTYAESQGFEEITLAAVEGDRLDHVIATVQSAAKAAIRVRLGLRRGVGWVIRGGERLFVPAREGRLVSLLPIESCRGVTLSGVQWPLENADLSPGGRSSVSNRATSSRVAVGIAEGSALLVVELPPEEVPLW